jgi:branched chain amino acid efflux pump
MTWGLIFGLAAGAYLFKVLGLVVIGDRSVPPVVERCLSLIPAALISAIIVKDTFSVGQHLQIDARVLGVGAAVIAAINCDSPRRDA